VAPKALSAISQIAGGHLGIQAFSMLIASASGGYHYTPAAISSTSYVTHSTDSPRAPSAVLHRHTSAC